MIPLPILKRAKTFLRSATMPAIPPSVADKFRPLDESARNRLEQSLKRHYFSQPENRFAATFEEYLASREGRRDLHNHLEGRLNEHRRTIIPWLHRAMPLSGRQILEIGCGSGSSTVALAEQHARVTAVDVNEGNIAAARDRCELYGLSADFLCANAGELDRLVSDRRFDMVIFAASLEHMTHDERMASMRETWKMLPRGGLWVVIETPNRLWFHDRHTALLPFYCWLPDDLAYDYARFSSREGFNTRYRDGRRESMKDFIRRGRGISYHEFELALKSVEQLKVIGSLPLFIRSESLLRRARWKISFDHRWEKLLMKVGPKIHRGFYQPDLYLIIEKD